MISARSTRVTLVTWIEAERTTTSLWLAGWLVGDASDKPGKSRAPTMSRLEIRAMMMMGAQGLGRKGVSTLDKPQQFVGAVLLCLKLFLVF